MTKSFLVAAGCLLVASAAWAGPPPGPEGSGNSVNTAFSTRGPTTTPGPSNKVQNAVPGSGNNVSAALAPTPAAKPAPQTQPQTQPMTSQAAQNSAFNAGAYTKASDCMTAASAAHQPLTLCSGLKK